MYACLRVPADPTPLDVARLKLPPTCIRPGCKQRWPYPSGVCGVCTAADRRRQAQSERVNCGDRRGGIRRVGYRHRQNGKPVGGPAE